ncbi:hypothetical protein J3Q64DRAFT_1631010, partial [Phycomyces blakesleeanus]
DENTTRLLELMIKKLQNRCFCSRIYASPNRPTSEHIIKRDFNMNKRNTNIMDSLTDCDGNTQQIMHFLTHHQTCPTLCYILCWTIESTR